MPHSKRSQRNRGPYSSNRVLDSSSPILSTDLRTFVTDCVLGWDTLYTEQEKRNIIETLPNACRKKDFDQTGNLRCPLSPEFVHSDRHLKASVSRFVQDMGDGFYNKSWRRKAEKAREERFDGKFDRHILDDTEERFGDDAIISEHVEGEHNTEDGKQHLVSQPRLSNAEASAPSRCEIEEYASEQETGSSVSVITARRSGRSCRIRSMNNTLV